MAKGASIILPVGSDENAAVEAVEKRHADRIRSSQGWYGNATVHIEGDDAKKIAPRTLIVKAVAHGWEVYGKIGYVENTIKVSRGKFQKV